MKKLILILLAVGLMASCSKKQDAKPALTPQNATAKDVAGDWLGVVDTTFTTTNGQTSTTINANTSGTHFKFNSDNTGLLGTSNQAPIDFTYKISDGIIIIQIPVTNNNSGGEIDLDILLITTNKLVVRTTSGTTHDDISFIKN
jgi:hypothetical protein